MQIAEVQGRTTLRRYLDALPQPARHLDLSISYRAAARMLPVAVQVFVQSGSIVQRDKIVCSMFGCLVIAGVIAAVPESKISKRVPKAAANLAMFGSTLATQQMIAKADTYAGAKASESVAYAAAHAALSLGARAANMDANSDADDGYSAHMLSYSAVDLDLWACVRQDLTNHCDGPLWVDEKMPAALSEAWESAKAVMQADPNVDWSFWIAWYERVLAGQDMLPDQLAPILSGITDHTAWTRPAEINALFDDVLAQYRDMDKDAEGTALSKAAYFDFVQVGDQMRAVAFPSDRDLFQNEADRESFLRQAGDLRTALEDWCDDAREHLRGTHEPLTPVMAIEKVLEQLTALERGTEVSLRDFVRRGANARRLTEGTKLRAVFGEPLHAMLIESLDQYSVLVREHLGDVLVALDPLRGLELGDLDPAAMLRTLKKAVARLGEQGKDVILPPDDKTMAILNDMIAELEAQQGEIGEATTDAARHQRGTHFAGHFGGTSATLAKLVKKGSRHTKNGVATYDESIKGWKRWDNLRKIPVCCDILPSGCPQ